MRAAAAVIWTCVLGWWLLEVAGLSSVASQEWRTGGGVVLLREFFPRPTFETVREECRRLRQRRLQKEHNSLAVGRRSRIVRPGEVLHETFMNDAIATRLSRITGRQLKVSAFPVELRHYEPGSFMPLHRDESMFVEPQVEIVFTVINSSDSHTEWKLPSGALVREWTEPNSMLVIEAEGAEHQVTRLQRGERTIIKCVYTSTDETTAAFDEILQGMSSSSGSPTGSKGRGGSRAKGRTKGKSRR